MDFIDKYHLLAWAAISIVPISTFIAMILGLRLAKEHKNLISYYSRYISTRQATNDVLEVIIYNLNIVKDMIRQAKTIIGNKKSGQDPKQQNFDHSTNDFDSFISQLPADNTLSVDRSYTAETLQRLKPKSPIKSTIFWLPSGLAIGLLLLIGLDPGNLPVSILILGLIVVVEVIALYTTIHKINQRLRMKQNTEKKLVTTMDLFEIRRIFIQDTITKLNNHLVQLNTFEDYCRDIGDANDYSKAIDILTLSIKKLEDIYEITNINVDTPLMSVTPILRKAVHSTYQPAAQQKGVRLVDNLEDGLSFHMSQQNIAKLVDTLVLDAINNSPVGQTVTLGGKPKLHQVEIEILENTQRFGSEQLANVFSFDPKTNNASNNNPSTLNLRIARLLVSTEAGEIKLSITKDDELSIRLLIPKARSHEQIKVNPAISHSSSRIS